MGIRILDGGDGGAVLYCSTTDWAFGPVLKSKDHAEAFLQWLGGRDFRLLDDAQREAAYHAFRNSIDAIDPNDVHQCEQCGKWVVYPSEAVVSPRGRLVSAFCCVDCAVELLAELDELGMPLNGWDAKAAADPRVRVGLDALKRRAQQREAAK